MELLLMVGAIIVGSAISLAGGALIFTTKKRRDKAILVAMPFGAGALLAAAFFDLLPHAFEMSDPAGLLAWVLVGFLAFFLLERSAGWFHTHHVHEDKKMTRDTTQRWLIVAGDLTHNVIDGIAIGAAFLADPAVGIITTIAVGAHEIPKELGTFALLLSRGWRDRKVLLANIGTAVGTLVAAISVYLLGSEQNLPEDILLSLTAGFFIYIAASDIIPDIHEQPQKVGLLQALFLVIGVVVVAVVISLLGHGLEH